VASRILIETVNGFDLSAEDRAAARTAGIDIDIVKNIASIAATL
jgi:hypothetical protein